MAALIDKILKKKRKQIIANDEINEQLVREHYARQEKDVSEFKIYVLLACIYIVSWPSDDYLPFVRQFVLSFQTCKSNRNNLIDFIRITREFL